MPIGGDDDTIANPSAHATQDLVDTLASTGALRVRPAGVVRSRGEQDPRELGRALEVDHVVVASLRRTRRGLRIAARLISVADGFQIWAHRDDCSEGEILAAAEQLGRGVATALSARAVGAERPTDPRAVDLYLRARAELRRFWGEHAVNAADLLAQAADLAPASPPILGALAFVRVQAWIMRGDPELLANTGRQLAALARSERTRRSFVQASLTRRPGRARVHPDRLPASPRNVNSATICQSDSLPRRVRA